MHRRRMRSEKYIALASCLFFLLITNQVARAGGPQHSQTNSPAAQQAAKPAPEPAQPSDAPSIHVDSAGLDPLTGIPYYKEIRENWSSLQVGSSELKPEPPVVTLPDEEDTFTRTLVALKWRPGDALDVYVILPKGVKKPPAVLYLYNYSDDTDRFKNDGWCRRVTVGGVAAIGFVSALSGQRFHDRPMKQWFVSELQESLGSTVHDVKFILDYLASRGDLDMDRIGMFGQGSGATIALLASAADSKIKAVDALDPWGDWPVWLAKSVVEADDPDRERHLKPEFLERVAPLDPVQWLPKVQAPYLRIQQNMEETATPRDSKDKIKAAAPPRTIFERYDTTAAFMNQAGRGMLFDWIKDAVDKPAASPASKNAAVASGSSAEAAAKSPVQR